MSGIEDGRMDGYFMRSNGITTSPSSVPQQVKEVKNVPLASISRIWGRTCAPTWKASAPVVRSGGSCPLPGINYVTPTEEGFDRIENIQVNETGGIPGVRGSV